MNRISPAVSNPGVESPMAELFGKNHWPRVKARVSDLDGFVREQAVLDEFEKAAAQRGIGFMQAFSFTDNTGSRTTHYIVHLCTHELGHGIMKDIMARKGGKGPEGFPTFHYDPTRRDQAVMSLFDGAEFLGREILQAFAGQRLTLEQVYLRHKGPYDRSNYRDAALALETSGAIHAEPSAEDRQEDTFGPDVVIRFPEEPPNARLED
jgi:hypothetical protein